MCQDPFLDQFQAINNAEPVISGLCRGLSNRLQVNDILIYITKIPISVLRQIGLYNNQQLPVYLGVAILKVDRIISSHSAAANTFAARQYIASPNYTPFPPNLAHNPRPIAALKRSACVTYKKVKTKNNHWQYRPIIGSNAIQSEYQSNYTLYHQRQQNMYSNPLPVALCSFLRTNPFMGGNIQNPRPLDPSNAPIITPADWGGCPINIQGICLNPTYANNIMKKF